jgi:alpha-D-xyloside xylohydrolase
MSLLIAGETGRRRLSKSVTPVADFSPARAQLRYDAPVRALLLFVFLVVAACHGDDGLDPAPDELSAGPVTIRTSDLTLTVAAGGSGSLGPLSIPNFLTIGTADEIDERHYYDPKGDPLVTLTPVVEARSIDGEWLVVEGGARLRLVACPNVPDCALLELDATGHRNAVQVRLALPRGATEPLYGTGDAALRANVAGTVREMQLRVDTQSESSLNETHVPIPLVLYPRRGIGVFVADDRPGALDLGAAQADLVTATFTLPVRGIYRVFIYNAPTPVDLVRRYTALTSRPAVPPRWAFAPQQWRNVHDSELEMRDDASQMRQRRIPGSVMWIDNPWQTAYNTFVVDETRFNQPTQLIDDLRAQGYKVMFWSTPYVGTQEGTRADHDEGAQRGFFVTDDAGIVLDYPWQNGPGALVDFTRDGATAWWRERIARVVSRGAAGFKLDFGEDLVPDIGGNILPMLLAGGDNSTHHARYSAGYHDAYLGALPPGDGFLITRAGAWGEQSTNTAIWPGDLDSDFTDYGVDNGEGKVNVGGLPSAIARGLSLSVSGYPFYGSDIGGFRGFPTTEALLRWAQYASLGTIMQLGGGGKSHNPWDTTLFDAGADAVYKTYADLHMQLNPMLWTLANQAGADGTPVTRPAAFVHDCACDDAMFLLGDDLLVAPVITAGATSRTAVLPPGRWVDRATGLEVTSDGTTEVTVPAPLDVLPMWQRVNSFVPMFALAADTILPATAPGVTSYATPAIGRELRLVYTPGPVPLEGVGPSTTLHDGANAQANHTTVSVTGGSEYSVFTIDVDGRGLTDLFAAPTRVSIDGTAELPLVTDVAACAAPGCWSFDAPSKKLLVRVFAPQGTTRGIQVF